MKSLFTRRIGRVPRQAYSHHSLAVVYSLIFPGQFWQTIKLISCKERKERERERDFYHIRIHRIFIRRNSSVFYHIDAVKRFTNSSKISKTEHVSFAWLYEISKAVKIPYFKVIILEYFRER